jgi:non-specific serine/threonine protein kinase
MNPERYQRIQALLQSALERESDERVSFLQEACAGDESLRRQLESLLVSYEQAGSFLESPAAQVGAPLVNDARAKLAAGDAMGPYRILSQIGSGGMAEVYLAQDTRLGRRIALKLLSASFIKDEERVRRFRQEASAASALNHPNILTIHEVGQTDSAHFIATEFIEGETLRQRLTRGQIPPTEALEITIQIASALSAAHAAGIVHRDIKPENIMIRRDGYVKVLDFGIAKLTERPDYGRGADSEGATRILLNTNPGMIMGTVAYMSPEQARGIAVDATTDIWSLGVVLYEMLTGHKPFEGRTMSHVIVSILEKEPPPLAQYVQPAPDDLQRIVKKALHKERDVRYQSVDALLVDLKGLKREWEFQAKLESEGRSDANYHVQTPTVLAGPTAAQIAEGHPNNLPAQLTPLIGREAEAKTVERLLRQGNARLVTLTGPGGTGKTRLSLEVGADMLGEFEDGVFLVTLASISDPSLVASAIAKTLSIKETAERPLVESLKDYLSDKQMLLLLDNFEQTLASAPLVVELLAAASRLKVVVTSRAVLHVSGEHQFPVPPLTVPDPKSMPPVEVLEQYSAVALFLKRVRAVKPNFALTDENASAVVHICLRLEGLPLAIELAAARIQLFPPQAMLVRLEDRLKLLTGGARDLPERQQTMRGAIDWSYDLLDEEEKKLFRRLSVFVDGCTLEAAEEVCSARGDLGIDFLDGMASLVDKSLQQQQEHPGEPRFRMLETIREYGLECLSNSEEAAAIRGQHANFFLKLAERIEQELLGPNQEVWLDRLENEHDNMRAALDWSIGSVNVELGLRLGGALWRFWEMRGYLAEGRARLAGLLAAAGTKQSKARIKALYAAGVLADAQGDYATARSLFEENLAINRKLGDKWGIANSLNNLGIVAVRNGDYAAARAMYEESLGVWRELGNRTAVALSLSNLGKVAENQDDDARACSLYEESLAIFRELEDKRGIAASLSHLGDAARKRFDYQTARSLYQESLAMFMDSGSTWDIANALTDLGSLACEQGDCAAARSLYEESMVIFGELGDIRGIARLLEGFIGLAIVQDQPERALRLAGIANTLRKKHGVPLPPDEQARLERKLEPVAQGLAESARTSAWMSGEAMSVERAIEYALAADVG